MPLGVDAWQHGSMAVRSDLYARCRVGWSEGCMYGEVGRS